MKNIVFALILLATTAYSQDTLEQISSNSIGGSAVSNTKQINFTANGDNSLKYKTYTLSNLTNYSVSWVNKKVAEEISNKTNFTRGKWFCLYMFTHSLTRKINYDNSIGVGYVHWWENISVSYGVIYAQTIYVTQPTLNVFRHSVRAKAAYKWLTIEYYIQPNIQNIHDVIITGYTKVNLFRGKKIGLSVNDVVNFRSTSTTKLIHTISLTVNLNIKSKVI
jgi:hypothetical protein